MTTRCSLFCLAFMGLGVFFSVQAVNGEDLSPRSSFPRAYGNLTERSVYHQNRIRGMKQNLNDYGGQVYDLRARFDRIFKNRDTNQPPPIPFDIGPKATLPSLESRSRTRYQEPDDISQTDRSRGASPRIAEEASPLAFVVEPPPRYSSTQPDDTKGKESQQVGDGQDAERKAFTPRKFDYYVLPRLGLALPTDDIYDSGISFATSGGIVRGDWRFGVDFTYSSNDSSLTRVIAGFPHTGQGETSAYSLLIGFTRDVPLGAGWIGSAGLGVGGGWSVADNTVLVNWQDREGGFAWQLGLGARRPFGETSSLFLGYRYLGHPTVSAHNIEVGAEVGF